MNNIKVFRPKLVNDNKNAFRATFALNWRYVGAETYVGKVGKWTVFIISKFHGTYYLTISLPGTVDKAVKSDSVSKLMIFARKVLKTWVEGCERDRNYENR